MILPFLHGISSLRQAPLTWLFVFLYVVFFVCFRAGQVQESNARKHLLDDEFFIKAQGKIYTQHILHNEDQYSYFLSDLASLSAEGDMERNLLLGSLAFRDATFLETRSLAFDGDQVEIAYWKDQLNKYLKQQDQSWSFKLGLTIYNQELFYFLSYQFVHGHVWHLLFNCWFLLIFGCFLEPLIGHKLFLLLYLLGGAVGAFVHIQISELSYFPLIGSSGSINALVGAFSLLYFKKPLRFLFFILPLHRWWGSVYLPTWFVASIWLIIDLSGYLSALNGFNYIAYSVHLGGFAFGLFCGLAVSLKVV